ncbi:DctP family TRAP transporter solute-binding subunit [Thiohalomonas denitrificans]|uniref:Tripartite ATP-independent transporter solute receptor, DctP family n=1 Tax=Thiohalomonas denitrificans TaxID=415747 RepID=A0A1G5QBY1_9GAMM|nr:DctP family TRAP transporter solute-binding subunit [Thiohalomonas denitrificans]SCZ59314.1 tripartite ATP-independent transporter solute receptor, DctP family [Thiohalomonas denitrificans]
MNRLAAAMGLALLFAVIYVIWPAPRPGSVAPETPSTTGAEWVLRFGHNIPADSALHQASVRFAEEVQSRSGGRVRVDVYPAQQLGNDHQMVEMARAGELDIILTPTAKLSVPLPAMQYADLPFYFPSRNDLYEMLDGEPGQILLDKLRSIGLIGVTFWENGFKQFTANRPLQRPEDFAGLNMRIMKSRILMEQFRALDAHPIPIDFHATREALHDGVVDGQENPLVAIVSMGIHQEQSHLTLSNHGYMGYVFSISAAVFERLPQEIRSILIDTARELTPWERAETHRREEMLLEAIREAGVTIHRLDSEAQQAFAERTTHIADIFEPVIGADLLSRTQELLDRKYSGKGNRSIVVGLDADLSMDGGSSGLALKRGAALAIEEINVAGGVLDKRLKLRTRDHKGMPSQGVRNLSRFIDEPEVIAVITGQNSPVTTAQLQPAHEAGLPLLAAWSSATGVVENRYSPNFVFRVSANDRLVAPFMLDHLLQAYRRPAILLENSVWGRSSLKAMREALAKRGHTFAHTESFNRGETEFAPYLTRIEQSGADVIVMVTNPHEGQLIVDVLAQRTAPLPLFSHWGITGGDFWSANREALEQIDLTFFQTFSFLEPRGPASAHLASRYKERYAVSSDRKILAPAGVAHAYDLVHLLAAAIEQAGSSDRAAVRDALERLKRHDGAVKRYSPPFTPERHDALGPRDYRMARFAEDGAIIPLRPGPDDGIAP